MTTDLEQIHTDRHRHLRLCREDVWGSCPDEPDWHSLPFVRGGYTVRARPVHFRPDSSYGGFRRTACLRSVTEVFGAVVTHLWPDRAELLLGMALDRIDGRLQSYCADHYTPPDPRRCLGLMVDTFRMEATGTAGDVKVLMALRGRAEEARPGLTEDEFDYGSLGAVPFRLDRATVRLDGAELSGIEAFALTVDNALATGPSLCGAPAFLAAGPRTVALELLQPHDSPVLDDALRDGGPLGFEATLSHPLGYVLTFELPVLHAEGIEENGPPGDLVRAGVRLVASTDDQGIDLAWSLNLNA